MNTPSYEVGRLAALTVRLALSSGLSRDEACAALGLAQSMIEDDKETDAQHDGGTKRPRYTRPAAAERGSGAMSRPRS